MATASTSTRPSHSSSSRHHHLAPPHKRRPGRLEEAQASYWDRPVAYNSPPASPTVPTSARSLPSRADTSKTIVKKLRLFLAPRTPTSSTPHTPSHSSLNSPARSEVFDNHSSTKEKSGVFSMLRRKSLARFNHHKHPLPPSPIPVSFEIKRASRSAPPGLEHRGSHQPQTSLNLSERSTLRRVKSAAALSNTDSMYGATSPNLPPPPASTRFDAAQEFPFPRMPIASPSPFSTPLASPVSLTRQPSLPPPRRLHSPPPPIPSSPPTRPPLPPRLPSDVVASFGLLSEPSCNLPPTPPLDLPVATPVATPVAIPLAQPRSTPSPASHDTSTRPPLSTINSSFLELYNDSTPTLASQNSFLVESRAHLFNLFAASPPSPGRPPLRSRFSDCTTTTGTISTKSSFSSTTPPNRTAKHFSSRKSSLAPFEEANRPMVSMATQTDSDGTCCCSGSEPGSSQNGGGSTIGGGGWSIKSAGSGSGWKEHDEEGEADVESSGSDSESMDCFVAKQFEARRVMVA